MLLTEITTTGTADTVHTLRVGRPRRIKTAVKSLLPERVVRAVKALRGTVDPPPPPALIPSLLARFQTGRALEIGAGKSPYCDPTTTVFLDKFTDNKDATIDPDIHADAAAMPLPDASFDLVFSSHCLEHCQNTIKTLREWLRVLKPSGVLFLVLPHADRTLDRFRARTPLAHHVEDFQRLTDAPDYSHVAETERGWGQLPDFDALRERFEREWGFAMWDWSSRMQHGVIHFHVWTQDEMIDLLKHVGLTILYVVDYVPERPDSFVVIARK